MRNLLDIKGSDTFVGGHGCAGLFRSVFDSDCEGSWVQPVARLEDEAGEGPDLSMNSRAIVVINNAWGRTRLCADLEMGIMFQGLLPMRRYEDTGR